MNKKILVVNNDFDMMILLKDWLEKRNYQVIYTGDGEHVPQLMKEFQPDLVLVDILQNKVAEVIKSNIETSGVPVLMMTGYANAIDYNPDNSDDIIEKPFNLKLLKVKLDKLIA